MHIQLQDLLEIYHARQCDIGARVDSTESPGIEPLEYSQII